MVVELKKGVTIDPGHGGTDPGAIGNGFREKDLTLQISLYQFKRFKELGVPVALTRDSDTSLDSSSRTTKVKSLGLSHCISNHINAGGGEGVEVIYSIHSTDVLAMKIAKAIVAVGHKFRRVFDRKGTSGDYYYMHRQTGAVQTLIIEYGFIDNITDIKRIKENIMKYAEAVVEVMCKELGFKYSAPVEKKKEVIANKVYRVVTGSFGDKVNADKRIADLKKAGFESFIIVEG